MPAPPTPDPLDQPSPSAGLGFEVAELTQPDAIYWCDGSGAEWAQLTDALVEAGTLLRLHPAAKPNSS